MGTLGYVRCMGIVDGRRRCSGLGDPFLVVHFVSPNQMNEA